MAQRLVLLGVAGALGTMARYGVQVVVVSRSWHPASATLLVNVTGCLLLGVAYAALDERDLLASHARTVFFTGFLGAFTTFSALMLDTARLARDESVALASANVAAQLVFGACFLALGLLLGRAL